MVDSSKEKNKEKMGSISSLLSRVNKSDKDKEAEKAVVVKIDSLTAGKYQPRRDFDEEFLNELAESIKEHGIIQPIIIRTRPIGDFKHEIIAGERRWRAAQIAGLDEIPAIIREVDDKTALSLGLIENIQRQSLTYLEEAQSFQRLKDEFNIKSKEVAEMVGKSEKEISLLLGLLKLPDALKALLIRGTVSPQILAVLKSCYRLDKEVVKKYVANKEIVTYKQASALLKTLKGNKSGKNEKIHSQQEKKEVEKSIEGKESQEKAGLDGSQKTRGSDQTEKIPKLNPISVHENKNDSSENCQFKVISVFREGKEWTLDLTHVDKEKEYCQIRREDEFRRIETRTLTILSIE